MLTEDVVKGLQCSGSALQEDVRTADTGQFYESSNVKLLHAQVQAEIDSRSDGLESAYLIHRSNQ